MSKRARQDEELVLRVVFLALLDARRLLFRARTDNDEIEIFSVYHPIGFGLFEHTLAAKRLGTRYYYVQHVMHVSRVPFTAGLEPFLLGHLGGQAASDGEEYLALARRRGMDVPHVVRCWAEFEQVEGLLEDEFEVDPYDWCAFTDDVLLQGQNTLWRRWRQTRRQHEDAVVALRERIKFLHLVRRKVWLNRKSDVEPVLVDFCGPSVAAGITHQVMESNGAHELRLRLPGPPGQSQGEPMEAHLLEARWPVRVPCTLRPCGDDSASITLQQLRTVREPIVFVYDNTHSGAPWRLASEALHFRVFAARTPPPRNLVVTHDRAVYLHQYRSVQVCSLFELCALKQPELTISHIVRVNKHTFPHEDLRRYCRKGVLVLTKD